MSQLDSAQNWNLFHFYSNIFYPTRSRRRTWILISPLKPWILAGACRNFWFSFGIVPNRFPASGSRFCSGLVRLLSGYCRFATPLVVQIIRLPVINNITLFTVAILLRNKLTASILHCCSSFVKSSSSTRSCSRWSILWRRTDLGVSASPILLITIAIYFNYINK